jgi:Cu+-exporting ATPase
MHREISHTDEVFEPPSNASLYLLTALLAVLIGIDLWPSLAAWLASQGLDLTAYAWPRTVKGYRFALIAAVIGGARVLYGSLESLFEGRLGADLALAVAAIAAILIGEPLVAAEVVFIGLVGECLESITFARTQRAVRKLVEVFPVRCWLLRDGREERVFVSTLQVGDRVVVKPGAKVPVDGVVVSGESAVNVSALTGESLPVAKQAGDEVLAGSLTIDGALTVEARRVAQQTVAGRVIELTARALKDKSPSERQADRLARYFLPVVLGLAALTFVGNVLVYAGPFRAETARLPLGNAVRLSVYPTLAVLVVACPCALILATPAAVIAALGRLAGTGVLIKGGSALERLAGVRAFAFDKTGTLTEGRLELGELVPLTTPDGLLGGSPIREGEAPWEGEAPAEPSPPARQEPRPPEDRPPLSAPDELLRLAASAEQGSEHPLGRLVLREAAARSLVMGPTTAFQARPGGGVTADSAGGRLVVGTRRFLEEQGVALPPEALAAVERLDAAGQTALLVARGGAVLGVIGARDRIRPEAAATVAELRALGIADIALLTGDRAAVARAVAAEVGITDVHAELLPQQKAEFLTGRAGTVAFVGDGINDAPALATAGVGIAIGSGTDVAAEAGDIVLMGDPLRPLPLLLRLSRETVRIIHQNIVVFAFGVNIVGIVLTGWLWPLVAPTAWLESAPLAGVLYHQLGSLAVLLNSMRLLAFERTAAPGTGLGRFKQALQDIDRRLERALNVEELLHELGHRWKTVLATASAVGALAWALSGLTAIGPDEIGIVKRFGRPLPEDLGPGLHWREPWPIETVTRFQPDRIRTVEVGFRSVGPDDPLVKAGLPGDTTLSWASPHASGAVRRLPDEAVLITGDGSLVELLATVRYRVTDPRRFLFEVAAPEDVVRAAAESALRETAAGLPIAELLTVRREEFRREAQARLAERCREYGGHGLGVELDGLALHDLHPPQEVVPAFHEVARAMERLDQQRNAAQADAIRKLSDAAAEALATRRKGEETAFEKVVMAEAARDEFLAWYRARHRLELGDELRLVGELLLAKFADGRDWPAAIEDYRKHREEAVSVRRLLIDSRLAWATLTAVLAGRDKVIIDADRVPGRRQLLLFDPEQLRPPPVILPRPDPRREE